MIQVRRTFSSPNWEDHHVTWKEQRYNWLPSWKEIPKHLHETLERGHLQKLTVSVRPTENLNLCYKVAAN